MTQPTTSSPRGTPTKNERNAAVAEMWDEGSTMTEIATHFTISRERVRQILATTGRSGHQPKTSNPDYLAASAKLMLAGEWLQREGLMGWDEFADRAGLTADEFRDGAARGLIPAHLVLPTYEQKGAAVRHTFYSTVNAVAAAYRASGGAVGVNGNFTSDLYDAWKTSDAPSIALIATRWRWADIAAAAGVPAHGGNRLRRVGLDEVLSAIRTYTEESIAAEQRPTLNGYERWSTGTDHLSCSSVRIVLRRQGLDWNDAVLTATRTWDRSAA